jgi:uncharacterized protein (TIGR02453 family)
MRTNTMSQKTSRFTQESLDFLEKAGKQKNPEWITKKQSEYEELIINPMKSLVTEVSTILKIDHPSYTFPTRMIGNIKRNALKAKDKGPFKNFLTFNASRDSGSMFEDLPSLHMMISKEESFIAGGLYMATAKQTKKIRSWVDQNPEKLEALFKDKNFKAIYKELGRHHEVKTKPRDYPIDHPRISWLKLTGWYVWRPLPKKDLFSKNLAQIVIRDWQQALRFNEALDFWLNNSPLLIEPEEKAGQFVRPSFDWDD